MCFGGNQPFTVSLFGKLEDDGGFGVLFISGAVLVSQMKGWVSGIRGRYKTAGETVWMSVENTDLFGFINSEFESAAEHIDAEAHQAVQDACGGEDAPDDATQTNQELPQWHVLFSHSHHKRTEVVLHEDSRDAVAAGCVVNHTLPFCDRILMRVCGHFVGLQFGGYDGDEVLKHLIMIHADFFCAVERIQDAWKLLAKRQVIYSMGEVVCFVADQGG